MSNSKTLLTVIVPVYNDETNITRCLTSIFNQSEKNIDIIVVNDASTDNTLDVVKSLQRNHNFRIINMEKNMGAGACRNEGVYAAQTPYITFVDSDDWIDISTYEKCYEHFKDLPDIIIFGLIYDYVEVNHREKKYYYAKDFKINGEYALNIYTHTIPTELSITPIVNNKIYRKQFLMDNNISFHEKLRYQEDDVFTFRTLSKADVVLFLKDGNYHYCQRENSLIHTVSDKSISGFVDAYVFLCDTLKADGNFEFYKKAFYLKFKSSLLGVIRRTIDYEQNPLRRNELLAHLLSLLKDNFDLVEILNTFDFSLIRNCLLQ